MRSLVFLFLALFGALFLASEVHAVESHEPALSPLEPGWFAPRYESGVSLGEDVTVSDALRDTGEHTHSSVFDVPQLLSL